MNDDVQCFVNAVYLTVMWMHLVCSNLGSWGLITATFLATVLDGIDSPPCRRSHLMLQSGFAQWQQLRGEKATIQQDFGEFLHYFLGSVCSKHVALTISRRFSRADEVVIAEKSDVHAPVLLHSVLWAGLCIPKRFQNILDNWQHTNGMIQALDLASHIVCFQICRLLDTCNTCQCTCRASLTQAERGPNTLSSGRSGDAAAIPEVGITIVQLQSSTNMVT